MQRNPLGRRGSLPTVMTFLAVALGCGTGPDLHRMIRETPQGAVFLERIPDHSFQAAHPIKLEPSLIARVLRGVYVQEKSAPQSVFTPQPKPVRAFSDEDVEFLTPLIVTALAEAAWGQRVGFRVVHDPADPASNPSLARTEVTAGILFAYGLSLHVTLSHYRHPLERPDMVSGPNRRLSGTGGMERREVLFLPEAARRPNSYRQSALGEGHLMTLAINYELLGKLPSSMLGPGSTLASQPPVSDAAAKPIEAEKVPAQTGAEPGAVKAVGKDAPVPKDMELEALKSELQSLRERIAEQEAQLQSLKGEKPKPKKSKK